MKKTALAEDAKLFADECPERCDVLERYAARSVISFGRNNVISWARQAV